MENQKLNTGIIFKNENKRRETQPDYNGVINANGNEFNLSLWIKTAKNGKKYFSVAVKEKEEIKEQSEIVETNNDIDDGMPF